MSDNEGCESQTDKEGKCYIPGGERGCARDFMWSAERFWGHKQ